MKKLRNFTKEADPDYVAFNLDEYLEEEDGKDLKK
jgi:hypothetical protein